MHDFIYNLSKKPEKEILEILGNKKYPTVGGYIIIYDVNGNSKISKIIDISKGDVITKDVLSGYIDIFNSQSIGTSPIFLFNFDFYRRIISEKCENYFNKSDRKTFSKILLKTLEDQYGADYVEVEDKVAVRESVTGKIYFPELEVTDGTFTHKLLDVYVFLRFRRRKTNPAHNWKLSDFFMFRSTVTYGEYKSNYFFSHFSRGPKSIFDGSYGSFCLGDSQISEVVRLMNGGTSLFSSIKEFVLLFDSYIRWESIDGGPYLYLNEITEFGIASSQTGLPSSLMKKFRKVLYASLTNIDYTISGVSSDPSIHIRSSTVLETKSILKQFLKEQGELENYLGVEYNGIFGTPVEPNEGIIQKYNTQFYENYEDFSETFKGETIGENCKVIKSEDGILDKSSFDISSNLISQVIDELLVIPIKKKFIDNMKMTTNII